MLWIIIMFNEIGLGEMPTIKLSNSQDKETIYSENGELILHRPVIPLTKSDSPPVLYTDSTGAKAIATNPEHHKFTKHIAVCHHLLRELVATLTICIMLIAGTENPADLFTKPLTADNTLRLARMLKLAPSTTASLKAVPTCPIEGDCQDSNKSNREIDEPSALHTVPKVENFEQQTTPSDSPENLVPIHERNGVDEKR